jgi:hypothetical protein
LGWSTGHTRLKTAFGDWYTNHWIRRHVTSEIGTIEKTSSGRETNDQVIKPEAGGFRYLVLYVNPAMAIRPFSA